MWFLLTCRAVLPKPYGTWRVYPDENGRWHVLIRGKYVPVPQGAIRDYPTPDGNSHVCEDENNGIMCFVRGLPKS